MPSALAKWIGVFAPEEPLRKVSNVKQRNRIANILADIRGIGCRISKPTNAEGSGWAIIVDGSSDVPLDSGISSVDRLVAINDNDTPGQLEVKLYGQTFTAQDSNDIGLQWDIADTNGLNLVRYHIKAAVWNGTDTLSYIVGKTGSGSIVLVPVTDTCAPGV